MDVLLNPNIANVSTWNLTYLLREFVYVSCLLNSVLNLSIITIPPPPPGNSLMWNRQVIKSSWYQVLDFIQHLTDAERSNIYVHIWAR